MISYESAQLYPHKNGGWRGQVNFKRPDGRWAKKTKVLKAKGKREAQRELEAWRRELEEQAQQEAVEAPEIATPTVGEYLDAYVQTKALHVDPSTVRSYRSAVENRVKPYAIAKIKLADVTPADCEKWQVQMSKDVSPVTAKKAFTLVKGAFKQAVERGELERNPLSTLKAAKQPKPKPNALDEAGRAKVAAFVDVDKADPFLLADRLALMCGLRRSECCGLQWRDVDLKRRTLKVGRSIGQAKSSDIPEGQRYKGHSGFYVKEPKTADSARTVALPASVCEALEERKRRMQAECLEAGEKFTGLLYVLGNPYGEGIGPHEVHRRWRSAASALGLRGTQGDPPTFHDLRHTYATAAIAAGVDVKTVSVQMGHANAAMTLNIYASPDPDAARRAADVMDEAIRPAPVGEVLEFAPTGTE